MCKRAIITSFLIKFILFHAIVLLIIPISFAVAEDRLVSVLGQNHSYETLCAEEDNINIPFIGEADSVIIKAVHSSNYQVEIFSCDADFTDCNFDVEEEYDFENPKEIKLYDDGKIYLLATRQASWWRPTGMKVWIDDNDYESNIHYIEIGQKIEYVDQWPTFFVLYEDGNLRLIPHPPEKTSEICFGSSVLVGSAEISNRPFADIESVHFISTSKTIEISYSNGDQFNILLDCVNRDEAEIRVEINKINDTAKPFVTFRSMFVAEGNADVDKVKLTTTDKMQEFEILSFSEDKGSKWNFFRSTRSQHNQSAPEIEITFFKTESDVPPQSKRNMVLPAGWSMISLPVVPNSNTISSLFPGAKVVYSYEKEGYVRVEELKIGDGYWILLDQNQTYTLIGQPIQSYNKIIDGNGWAMIGGCTSDARPITDNCSIGVIYRYVQETGYQRVLDSEKLKSCGGFWIQLKDVMDQCELTVEAIDPTNYSDLIDKFIDWRTQDYYDSKGITNVTYNSGEDLLLLSCNLKGQDTNFSSGEILLDLKYVPRIESHVPIDMTDKTFIVEIDVPSGFIGSSSRPNGIQIFVKDENYFSQYGTWNNIISSGKVNLTFTPSTTNPHMGHTDSCFDPTKIRTIGIKFGINSTSTDIFNGDIYVNKFDISPPLTYTPLPQLPDETPIPFVSASSDISLKNDGFYSNGKKWFVVGGNWRMIEYGQNFGVTAWFPGGNGVSLHRGFIGTRLEVFRQAGITLVRVGLLDDGRTIFDFDGNVVGYNDKFREDVYTILDLAKEKNIMVEFAIADFLIVGKEEEINGVWLRGRREIIEDPQIRAQFITDFFEPFLSEFGSHPALFGFDLMNEPEWIISSSEGGGWEDVTDDSKDTSPINLVDLYTFFNESINKIRQLAPKKFVTVGVSIKFMDLVKNLDLDYLALHYYPWMGELSELLSEIPDSEVWLLEEFPGNGNITDYLNVIYDVGGDGALLWNLSPEIDDQSYLFEEEERKLQEVRTFVDKTDGTDITIELLSPEDGKTLLSGNVTFKWEVENAGNHFTSRLLLDKGVNPYDGLIETSYTITNGVMEYTKYFSDVWWGCFDWGIEVNGYKADDYFHLCISDKASDHTNMTIELLSPEDNKTLPSGDVTFRWKVENAGDDFTTKLLLDKGVNPYDGSIETSYTITNGVMEYTKYFSASWWDCFDWGIEVNGYEADDYFELCISDN